MGITVSAHEVSEGQVLASRVLFFLFAVLFGGAAYYTYFVRLPPLFWPSVGALAAATVWLIVAFLPSKLMYQVADSLFAFELGD